MQPHGDDWERFRSRHLGDWHGRSLAISTSDGSLISSTIFFASSEEPNRSKTNPSSLLLSWNVSLESDTPQSSQVIFRYNLDKLHVFADGSYSADHTIVELGPWLPEGFPAAQHVIEFALPISATERSRALLIYNEDRLLTAVILLEEARSGLFDTRPPLSLTSLVGEWRGLSETFRHDSDANGSGIGFGSKKMQSPSTRARRVYDEQDLPPQLKNPSGGEDGLLKTKTTVAFGWDPAQNVLRRNTVVSDMQDNVLGQSVVYGAVDEGLKGLFDIARFESNTENETLFLLLSNACFVVAPAKRVRGVTATSELGCLVTPGYRRRLTRIYGKNVVAFETLASESLYENGFQNVNGGS